MGGIARIMPSWVCRGFEEVRAVGNGIGRGVASTLEKVGKVYESHKGVIGVSVMALCAVRTSIPAVEISESLILFSLAGVEFELFLHYCDHILLSSQTLTEKFFPTVGMSVIYATTGFMKGLSFLATRVPTV